MKSSFPINHTSVLPTWPSLIRLPSRDSSISVTSTTPTASRRRFKVERLPHTKADWDFMRLCAISLVSESFKKKSVSSSSCVFIQRVAVLEMNLLLDYWNKKLIKPRVSYWLGFSLRQSSAERRESKGFIFSFFLPDGLREGIMCVILELWLQKMLNTRLQTRGSLLDHKSAV